MGATSTRPTAEASKNSWFHNHQRSNAHLLTPLISTIIFLMVISLIFWTLHQREQQEQQEAAYRHTSWAQQQILLTLRSTQEQLSAFAQHIGAGLYTVNSAKQTATEIIQAYPAILFINWLDKTSQPNWQRSPKALTKAPLFKMREQIDGMLRMAFDDARLSKHQVYSLPHLNGISNGYITLQTPIYRNGIFHGTIAAVYSIKRLLTYELPSELTANYKISIINKRRHAREAPSYLPPWQHYLFYELPLPLLGEEITIRAYAYARPASHLINNTLAWLVMGLCCFVLWSLWSLWRYGRQRLEAQQALYAETSFRRALENSMLIGMRVVNMQARMIHVNHAFCRMVGWSENELLRQVPPYPYWPDEANCPEMQQYMEQTLEKGLVPPEKGLEFRLCHKNGTLFDVCAYIWPLIDSTGQQTGWISALTDITESKSIREELAAARAQFTTVLESLDAAVSVLAPTKTKLLFANRYYYRLFGMQPTGHLKLASGHDNYRQCFKEQGHPHGYSSLALATEAEGATGSSEIYIESMQKWFEVRCQNIQWIDGHLVQMQIATDITARKQGQEEARRQEEKLQFTSRLVTMGEMASSLAHELNQPLAAIHNYCSGTAALVKAGSTQADKLLPVLEKTAYQAVRAGMIIKRIREFVQRSEPRRQEAKIMDIVADAIGLAELETRKHSIRIVTDICASPPTLYVDPVLIEQVLINLLKNAAEAMSGSPDFSTENVIRLVIRVDSDSAAVSVIDQGPGLNQADTEMIFSPFYSTKSNGMGMGLNICRSIIEAHQGRLWVENNAEKNGQARGCSFCFSLPIAASEEFSRLNKKRI